MIRLIHGNVKQRVVCRPLGWLIIGWKMLWGYTNTLYTRPDCVVKVRQVERSDGSYMIFEVRQ